MSVIKAAASGYVLPEALRAQIMMIFVEEGVEILDNVERLLDSLSNFDGRDPAPIWLEIQRGLHTLKGSCAAAGAVDARASTHMLEERLQEFAERRAIPSDVEAHGIFDALSALRKQVLEVAQGPCDSATQAENSDKSALSAEAAELPESKAAAQIQMESARKTTDFLRVRQERIDALDALVGELVLTRLQNRALIERVTELRGHADRTMAAYRELDARLRQRSRALPATALRGVTAASRALGTELVDLTREAHLLSRQAPLVNAQAVAVSSSLEESIRDLRLMPLGPFFDEYAAVVREAARHDGKMVRLEIRAEGAEIDRAVLLKLREPLLHLVRNAVVHGIEPPDERSLLGKHPQGCVSLEATCEGTRAVICVRDDGAGVNVAQVLEKARRHELANLSPDAASPREVLEILTHPGFSTRDQADHLSGRGIGLDIVANVVGDLGGQLALDFQAKRGTTFRIEVPITAATSRGVVMRVGDQSFALMLNRVERILRLGWDDIRHLEGRPTVTVGSEMLSVVELAKLLNVRGDGSAQKMPALVLKHGRQRLVVLVDDVPCEQALVIRPFGRAFARSELFLGGAVQADGSVLPVIHADALFAHAGAPEISFATRALPANDNQGHLLVVDDSITMRTMLRNILSASGYQVVVASDGHEALMRLYEMPQCDGVITDLQMPNMDGVDLCRAIRARGGSYLPVVMVTSVGDAAERRKALEAGADAYLIKAEFEQTGFLERLKGLLGLPHGRAS